MTKILKESLGILILSSIISLVGGIGLGLVQDKIFVIIPFVIIFPALNDMVGDFSTIISSKFTTMLYLGEVDINEVFKDKKIHKLLSKLMAVALLTSIYLTFIGLLISYTKNFRIDHILAIKVLIVTITTAIILVSTISALSLILGIIVFKRNEDPDNFLIPISTSIADFFTMIFFSFLIDLFF